MNNKKTVDTKIKTTRARKEFWTLDKIKKGLDLFYKEHKHYPTATEFDAFTHLPSTKTIERKFGGLVSLRKLLDLEGQLDFRSGKHSTERAKRINQRAHILEKEIYDLLVKNFGVEFVHREYFLTDDHRTRIDFYVYYKNGTFSVDIFFPSDMRSFFGCLNVKIKKYEDDLMLQSPVIFLQMNTDLSQEKINIAIGKKRHKLKESQQVMCIDTFKNFISSLKSR